MSLTPVQQTEPLQIASIRARFKHAAPIDIERLLAKPAALILHLAQAHDLTTNETAELLGDCLASRAKPLIKAA